MKVHIYRAKDGRIIAESGEAYTGQYDCKKAFYTFAERLRLEGINYVVRRGKA